MTTILAVYNIKGCVGRCDANCHQAAHAKCSCICGGANHGKGKDQATDRIGDLRRFAEAHGYAIEDLHVVDRLTVPNARRARRMACDEIRQPDLFR